MLQICSLFYFHMMPGHDFIFSFPASNNSKKYWGSCLQLFCACIFFLCSFSCHTQGRVVSWDIAQYNIGIYHSRIIQIIIQLIFDQYLFYKLLFFYGPFYWWGSTWLKATEPLRGDSLLFTIQFTKAELTLEPPSGFEPGPRRLGAQHLEH